MAYVPPHLRMKTAGPGFQEASSHARRDKFIPTSSVTQEPQMPRLDDIQTHFWPKCYATRHAVITQVKPPQSEPVIPFIDLTEEDVDGQNPDAKALILQQKQHSTLNATEEDPETLRYILLFRDANPRWKSDNIIYAKTNLHLLPRDRGPQTSLNTEAEPTNEREKPSNDYLKTPFRRSNSTNAPIMIFEQVAGRNGAFSFLGYFRIDTFQLLEPNSPELVRMLEQKSKITNKYGRTCEVQRDAAEWKASLNRQWAVLKFARDEKADAALPKPSIEVSQIDVARGKINKETQKSVNDLLAEMRRGQTST